MWFFNFFLISPPWIFQEGYEPVQPAFSRCHGKAHGLDSLNYTARRNSHLCCLIRQSESFIGYPMQFKACTVIFYLSLQNLPSAVCLLGSLNNVQGDKSMALLCDSAKGLKKEKKVFFPFFFFLLHPHRVQLVVCSQLGKKNMDDPSRNENHRVLKVSGKQHWGWVRNGQRKQTPEYFLYIILQLFHFRIISVVLCDPYF